MVEGETEGSVTEYSERVRWRADWLRTQLECAGEITVGKLLADARADRTGFDMASTRGALLLLKEEGFLTIDDAGTVRKR